jgi:3-phenylpropionate/trans-cinnamate dioxygenase ferredoxin reductase subunit
MGAGLVIVGGSYAAVHIAASARQAGYAEPIRLVSDEPHPPYQRPPLSKGFLLGQVDPATLPIRGEAFYRDQAVELVLAKRITEIDRGAMRVRLGDRETLAYDRLALATGARARRIEVPGAALDGVLSLRSLDDAQRLRQHATAASSVAVVGGGYVGLEIAAALVSLGKRVTVIEAQDRLLARALPRPLSSFLLDEHARRGVEFLFNAQVAGFVGQDGRVRGVMLADGTKLAADAVVVGIGAVANTELAAACGLRCDNGIVVDEFAITTDPLIVAAGDCTSHPNPFACGSTRLESVQNAVDQGKSAGAAVVGVRLAYGAVPWFWSDQYDLKLQSTGLSRTGEHCVLRGAMGDRAFSLFHFRGDALCAVDSVNRPGEHMIARKLVASRARLSPAQAADPSYDLRSALAR